jgi:SAM-dependent methyltransferase
MSNIQDQLLDDYAHLHNKRKSTTDRHSSIRRLQRLLSPHCPQIRHCALDLGAGQGELVEALLHLGFRSVDGVELSSSQVNLAVSHGCHSVRQVDGSLALSEYSDSSLDLVCCFDVFEHLPQETCAHWFDEINRVLKPGGRLIGHVPNGVSPFVGAIFWGDLTHIWCPVPESIQVFCRRSGLLWLGAYENIGASIGLIGRLRSVSWSLVRSLLAMISTIETGRFSFRIPWSRTFLFVAERT